MNSDEYAYLHQCGVDFVTVFQETYDSDRYETLHLAGHKRVFPYRINAQERALMGGMGRSRALLRPCRLPQRRFLLQGHMGGCCKKKYPHAEIFSLPSFAPHCEQ